MARLHAPSIDALTWRCCAFCELSVHELQSIHTLRQQVFIIEQQCIYLDADANDRDSLHLAAWQHDDSPTSSSTSVSTSASTSISASTSASASANLPVAYARLVRPGAKYAEPSIGRVITAGPARGTGLGRELVRRAIAETRRAFAGQPIRISAQSRLEAFYAEAGFVVIGEPYLEDGIPHTEMLLAGEAEPHAA